MSGSRPVSGFGPYPGGIPPTLGEVLFYSERDLTRLAMKLGDGPALVTEGYGGWDKIARPRRHALTEWVGQNGYSVTIPVLFDGFSTNESVEVDVRTLERFAYLDATVSEPPQIVVDGLGVVPHDYSQEPRVRWVVEDISWNAADFIRRLGDGKLVRASATITVLEFVRDDRLAKLPPARKHSAKKGGATRAKYVTIHKGDTLAAIANKHHTTTTKLKKLNKIRDPAYWLAHHDRIRIA
jgi:hypothetical protein